MVIVVDRFGSKTTVADSVEVDSDILDVRTKQTEVDSDITNLRVTSMSDFTDSDFAHGQVIGWDSDLQMWRPSEMAAGGGGGTLDALSNVDTTGVTHGQFISWDSDTNMWVPNNGAVAGSTTTVNNVTVVDQIIKSEQVTFPKNKQMPYGRGWSVDNDIMISGRSIESGFYGNNLPSYFTQTDGVDITEMLSIPSTEEVNKWSKFYFGPAQVFAISDTGKLFVGGNNQSGALGLGNTVDFVWPLVEHPDPLLNGPGIECVGVWNEVKSTYLTAPKYSSTWVCVNGNGTFKTYSMGNNETTILANNTFETEQYTPYHHSMLDGKKVTKVVMDMSFGVNVVTDDGALWYSGTGYGGNDGLGGAYSGSYNVTLEQCKIDASNFIENVVDVVSVGRIDSDNSGTTVYALDSDGKVWSCGSDISWILQGSSPTIDAYFHPVRRLSTTDLTDIVSIHARGYAVFFLRNDGQVFNAGVNRDAVWGSGFSENANTVNTVINGQTNIEKIFLVGDQNGVTALTIDTNGVHRTSGSNTHWLCGWSDFSKEAKANGDVLYGFGTSNKIVDLAQNTLYGGSNFNTPAQAVAALTANNKVYVWGDVSNNALTMDSNLPSYKTPTRIRPY